MIKDFVTVDKQKNVRHRATIGSIADFIEAGLLPESMKEKKGAACRHDFGGRVQAFVGRSERSVENYLRRMYA